MTGAVVDRGDQPGTACHGNKRDRGSSAIEQPPGAAFKRPRRWRHNAAHQHSVVAGLAVEAVRYRLTDRYDMPAGDVDVLHEVAPD